MGKALRKFNIPRRKVTLMTKCFRVVCDEEHFDPGASVLLHHELAASSKDYVNQSGKQSGNHLMNHPSAKTHIVRIIKNSHHELGRGFS